MPIHKTAIVAPSAKADENATVGTFARAGKCVVIEAGTQIHTGAVVDEYALVAQGERPGSTSTFRRGR